MPCCSTTRGLSGCPAAFLGVEVFFVISGFIITRALLREWQEAGRIDLRAFWLRRARRLLPTLFLLLAGVMAYTAAFEADVVASLRADVLAALAYVTNWHLILGDQSYFASFEKPSLLLHLWSLAIEEQFYFGLAAVARRPVAAAAQEGNLPPDRRWHPRLHSPP